MGKYYATIKLYVDLFDADDWSGADKIVSGYVDELAKCGGSLTWCEVDWVTEIEEEDK
jgi:hypothetical protein